MRMGRLNVYQKPSSRKGTREAPRSDTTIRGSKTAKSGLGCLFSYFRAIARQVEPQNTLMEKRSKYLPPYQRLHRR